MFFSESKITVPFRVRLLFAIELWSSRSLIHSEPASSTDTPLGGTEYAVS